MLVQVKEVLNSGSKTLAIDWAFEFQKNRWWRSWRKEKGRYRWIGLSDLQTLFNSIQNGKDWRRLPRTQKRRIIYLFLRRVVGLYLTSFPTTKGG